MYTNYTSTMCKCINKQKKLKKTWTNHTETPTHNKQETR